MENIFQNVLGVNFKTFWKKISSGIRRLHHNVKTAGMVARGEHGSLRTGIHALISGIFLVSLLG